MSAQAFLNIRYMCCLNLLTLFQSCATLYSGRDLPVVSEVSISNKTYKTATIRFVQIMARGASSKGSFLSEEQCKVKELYNYLNRNHFFSEIKLVHIPFESATVESNDDLENLLKIPSFDTDYFIDVRKKIPFNPHGGGFGMWGGVISIASLGIIPAWWSHTQDFEVFIHRNNEPIRMIELKENYNAFHSSLFHLSSKSEYTFRKCSNEVDRNALRNLIFRIEQL